MIPSEHQWPAISPASVRLLAIRCFKHVTNYITVRSKTHFQQALSSVTQTPPRPEPEATSVSRDATDSLAKRKKTFPCPQPGCRKEYKQLSGLRYHLAHVRIPPCARVCVAYHSHRVGPPARVAHATRCCSTDPCTQDVGEGATAYRPYLLARRNLSGMPTSKGLCKQSFIACFYHAVLNLLFPGARAQACQLPIPQPVYLGAVERVYGLPQDGYLSPSPKLKSVPVPYAV